MTNQVCTSTPKEDLVGKEHNPFKIQLIKILIYSIIIVTVIQQFTFLNSYYSIIRIMLYLMTFLAIVISSTEFLKIKVTTFVRIFTIFFLFFQFLSLIGILYGNSFDKIGTLYLPILVSFFIYMISFVAYNKINFYGILVTYVVAIFPLAIDVFKYYFNNTLFISSQYLVSRKGIGVVLGFAILISIYLILNVRNKMAKMLFLFFIIFYFLILNLIRERGMLLALYISIIIFVVKSVKINKVSFLIFLLLFTALLFFLILFPTALYSIVFLVIQPFVKGFNISDLNNLSAGRIQLFSEALKVFETHPIIGTLGLQNYFVDNTFLISIANYGLVGASLYIIFSCFLVYIAIVNLIRSSISNIKLYVSLILIDSLIISLTSGIAPFGPGTVYIMLWVLLPIITSKDKK